MNLMRKLKIEGYGNQSSPVHLIKVSELLRLPDESNHGLKNLFCVEFNFGRGWYEMIIIAIDILITELIDVHALHPQRSVDKVN